MSLEEVLDVEVYCNDVPLNEEWLKLSEAEIRQIIQEIIWRNALRILDLARAAAPQRTGALKASGQTFQHNEGATIQFTVPYALFVEKGHVTRSGSFVPGQEFLGNATAMILPEIEREIDEEINDYLRMRRT